VDEEAVGIIELPCLENATKIQMRLGCLGLAPPDSGVFARLETLLLNNVRSHGERELSEAVSSARCPSLRRLTVRGARGLRNLLIRSESLVALMLAHPRGLRRLMVVAPVLHSFYFSAHREMEKLAARISAPKLEKLKWAGRFQPSFIQRARLQELDTNFIVYGRDGFISPHHLRLFRHFEAVSLHLLVTQPDKVSALSPHAKSCFQLNILASSTVWVVLTIFSSTLGYICKLYFHRPIECAC
jgi:hypothetical protein